MEINKIYCGDSLHILRTLPAESVDCVVTSPPYYCLRDYGIEGQIGHEKSPKKYIENLVKVFTEAHRVLAPEGTMWVVIGDSYAGSGRGWGDKNDLYSRRLQPLASHATKFTKPHKISGYKNKDLMGIPWQLAFSLRDAGWYLRQDIIWHKPNPMPESMRDRCTKAHEYIFFFSKSAKYYFDQNAITELANYDNRTKIVKGASVKYVDGKAVMGGQTIHKGGYRWKPSADGRYYRNKRSVWTVPTKGFKGAHFATFPPDLIKTCIEAGCAPNGIVLDPFMGAGTTAVVAKQLGRNYVGIELNSTYVDMAERRIASSM